MSTLTAWLRRWGPSLLVMVMIYYASDTPGDELPHFGIWDFVLKKSAHMLGYALLGAFFVHGLTKGSKSVRRLLLTAIVMAGLYAMSDELHQSFTSGRKASWLDVGIDTSGAILGAWAWIRVRRMTGA